MVLCDFHSAAQRTQFDLTKHAVQVDGAAGPFEFITYEETAELAAAIGSALTAVGVSAHDKCSIYGGNSAEWMIAMQVPHRLQKPQTLLL